MYHVEGKEQPSQQARNQKEEIERLSKQNISCRDSKGSSQRPRCAVPQWHKCKHIAEPTKSHQPSPQWMHYLTTLSPPSWEQNLAVGLTFGTTHQTLTRG